MASSVGEDDKTVAERFIEEVLVLAVKTGDVDLVREVFDRHDGKQATPAPPKSPSAGAAGQPITANVQTIVYIPDNGRGDSPAGGPAGGVPGDPC